MSENSSKIGKYQFVAEPFHVDFTGRLTMGVLGNHLLNCAGFHASCLLYTSTIAILLKSLVKY